ncbi:hypothetical protein SEA_RIBEYE_56 [Gordonia phage Ribeye]|uniref:Uncharacterized protein n=1 Tax=Gordonia phage Ribeye TaxID=2250417 RepID=A0A345KPG7_9CAUD|nr:hypothetical protein J1768_gp56 [Gordonia phage Ribeye]AXH44919.1 hypothetical protein SEA_RIBEYE_56 [Gordonia phage Ribeye]
MNNQPDRHKPDMDTPRTPRDIAQLSDLGHHVDAVVEELREAREAAQ